MTRLSPRSTLFPYTTLFRSVRTSGASVVYLRDVAEVDWSYEDRTHVARHDGKRAVFITANQQEGTNIQARSEEHTSELQSRQYLVCRLLLEKKKQSIDDNTL